MEPVTVLDGISKFTKNQVDIYGCPSYYGFEKFEVIETCDSIEYVTDFKMEQSYKFIKRVVHVYCRVERFQTILSQLMCMSINVSNRVMKSNEWLDMLEEVANLQTNHWIQTRKILKRYNFNSYYNRIPGILAIALTIGEQRFTKSSKFDDIMRDFKKMHCHFEEFKGIKYKYFPNLRFVALKLMQYHQVYPKYDIPLAITKSKILSLEATFDDLWYFINMKL